eukprot:scaffold100976_cov51-Attheya_sp.AAC.1
MCQIFKGIDSFYSLNPENSEYESNLKLPTSGETLRATVLEGSDHSYSRLIDIISDIVASGRELDISGMFLPSDNSEVTGLGGTL